MGLDSLKNRVSDFKDKETDIGLKKDELDIEISKADELISDSSDIDDNIFTFFKNVRNSFDKDESEISDAERELEKEKSDLRQIINSEQDKLNIVQQKIDGLSGKRYTDGLDSITKKCDEMMSELDKMLMDLCEDGGIHDIGDIAGKSNDFSAISDNVNFKVGDNYKSENSKKETMKSLLSKKSIAKISPGRPKVVETVFAKAPPQIISALESHAGNLKPTKDTGYSFNKNGEWVKDSSYYSTEDHQVRMDESLSDEEYGEIITHELSHFLDQERGFESRRESFVSAINSDVKAMDKSTKEGKEKFNEMLDDAFSTGAAFDRNVSDILSAAFKNDPDIVKKFDKEGVPYYGHRSEYWERPYTREAEIYANNGAVICSNERISKNFLERYFSNIYKTYRGFYNL